MTLLVFALFLPKVASYSDVWDTITDMTWLEVTTLAIVALWNLISYQPVLMAALPGLSFTQSTIASQASTAVANTAPAGAAFGLGLTARMYRSWGFKRRPVTLSLLVSGIWNNLVKLILPIVALALVVASGDPGGGLVVASIIGMIALVVFLGLFTAILRSERAAFAIGERGSDFVNRFRLRRNKTPIGGFGHTVVKFRRETIGLVRERSVALTITTIVSQLSLFLVLLIAMRHIGISNEEVTWQEALATFAFVRLLAAVPITPGGLGVVELGLTGGLVAAGGDHAAGRRGRAAVPRAHVPAADPDRRSVLSDLAPSGRAHAVFAHGGPGGRADLNCVRAAAAARTDLLERCRPEQREAASYEAPADHVGEPVRAEIDARERDDERDRSREYLPAQPPAAGRDQRDDDPDRGDRDPDRMTGRIRGAARRDQWIRRPGTVDCRLERPDAQLRRHDRARERA